MFYAVFFISFLVSYIILSWSDLNLYTIIVTAIATVIFWYETIKAWRNKPF